MNDRNRRIKIAILHAFDARDIKTWSGTNYHIAQTLQKYCGEISYISPLPHRKAEVIGRIIHKCTRVFLKKNFMYFCSFLFAKRCAKVAMQLLTKQSFDVIVAPAASTEVALLETGIPIVLVEDSTYALLLNYLPQFSNLLKRSRYEVNTIQELAIKKASLLIYSTAWAAQSAIEDYHADKRKVQVVPFGANFPHIPPKEIILNRKKSDRCRLLFVGNNWPGKGGDIAFETLLKLEEMGIQAELTICGCTPPNTVSHEKMIIIPFLDKDDERQRKRLQQLYISSDFLLLPTRYDCFGIVFCEAGAYGLPSITTNTGGVPEVVRDGENGFVLPYNARGNAYAEVIAKVYQDDQLYGKLVRSSRAAYDERLNWDAWGVNASRLITEMLDHKLRKICL